MELRDEDFTRVFPQQRIILGRWRIWRAGWVDAPEEYIVEPANVPSARWLLDERFATWIAWKEREKVHSL